MDELLELLDLTTKEKSMYKLIFDKPKISAKEVSESMKIKVNSIYRLSRKLRELNLIEEYSTSPIIRYIALPLNKSVKEYIKNRTKQTMSILKNIKINQKVDSISLLFNKKSAIDILKDLKPSNKITIISSDRELINSIKKLYHHLIISSNTNYDLITGSLIIVDNRYVVISSNLNTTVIENFFLAKANQDLLKSFL